MKAAKRRSVALIVGSALLAITAVCTLSYQNHETAQAERESLARFNHLSDLQDSFSDVVNLLTEIESAQRGFLLTMDTRYLGRYYQAREEFQWQMDRLKKMLVTDLDHTLPFQVLQRLIDTKLAELDNTVELASSNRREQALEAVRYNIGEQVMITLRARADEIANSEKERAEEYRTQWMNARDHAQLITMICIWLAVLATAITLVSLIRQRHFQDSHAREVALAAERMAISNDALELSNRELSSAIEAAQAANRAKSNFIATATHDLRQPLHALSLLLSALGRRVQGDEANLILSRVVQATKSMQRMFNDLLDVSRIDAGVMVPQIQSFEANMLLDQLATAFRAQAGEKGIAFRYSGSTRAIDSDPALLERVLRNLLTNALRFTERGRVLLGCRLEPNHLRIEVHDTGVGIPNDKLDAIFVEFTRLQQKHDDGMGLGLAIVRRLIALLGHSIKVTSREGKGSCFAVTVPLSREGTTRLTVENPQPVETTATRKAAAAAGVVLVVEDDALVLGAIDQDLRDRGYRIVTAADVPSAVATVKSLMAPPSAMLLDFQIGKDNGFTAKREIEAALGRSVPTIFVTGSTDPETLDALTASGIGFHLKPLDPSVLTRSLEKLL